METNKIYSVYVHKVNTEQGPMYYAGVTTMKLWQRWKPSAYKTGSLWPYIGQYGWENIEHIVVFETTDREMAYKTEDMLICGYTAIGRCINKCRSGLYRITDENSYRRSRYASDTEYAERIRQRERNKLSTPEGKIYDRVKKFNYYHPDRITESPLEARDNYRKYHIVPQYIKHDDI